MKLYEKIAEELNQQVSQGFYQVGEKLPSIRSLSKNHNISISTAQEAYRLLEDQGVVEVRPKSGYYVCQQNTPPRLPDVSRPIQRPIDVSQWHQVLDLLTSHTRHGDDLITLGRALPDYHTATLQPLLRTMASLTRDVNNFGKSHEELSGLEVLRVQIVRQMIHSGCQLHPDDIIITNSCQEALSISIQVTTKPGDVVAVDSPSFYGTMQTLRSLQLKVLEIPTHPETGISIEALELALEQWPITAVQVTPSCNNPLGYTMPDNRKKQLYQLAQRFDIAIIEDDIFGDLSYNTPRSRTIKSFDQDGRVILCSSFSKTIAPGFRLGWAAPGRYCDLITHMKYVSSGCTATIPQLALAEFMVQGSYERHLRKIRQQYKQSRDIVLGWLKRYLPENIRTSYPQGGFLLWIELPDIIDSVELNRRLTLQNVQIAPGILFSATGKYRNCIRINYSGEPSARQEQAIKKIGAEVFSMLEEYTE
ncbi:PLP-dependent aminotransferase family protein [Spartinivicinus poritis]|uniref:PLP-dependent aminotransferase family protein n=1 Tax=Spartinivicinus poritis TaxID=2994640 RepID=A0ABT5UEY2_9GAMM|nr:PLP-dependent aminotransferase family protein [Spartinivicinus sp. A2-2]MDE1464936.1 PLP-dependent aminotransferase family protein [Spartinivicinus sp. A2-2]